MISISVVVTAPSGIADCIYLDDLTRDADGLALELVIVDGASRYVDQSRKGVRHIPAAGSGIQGLIRTGIANASLDWVLVTEDHCRPLPGLLDEYRKAITANPDMDLFSGTTQNLTSTSSWSVANFFVGLPDFWPEMARKPLRATNANLLVRRSAIQAKELAGDGGFLNWTMPRLIRSGRYAHCARASVDHVLPLSRQEAIWFQFDGAIDGRQVRHASAPKRPVSVEFARDILVFGYFAMFRPVQTMLRLRGTRFFTLAMALRIFVLNAAQGAGLLHADFRDLVHRSRGRRLTTG